MDWWAFGVLTYEMLLGQSPFRGDDEDEIFDAILEDEPLYPITMPRDAVSLLQRVSPLFRVTETLADSAQLLTRDPARRLGAGESDAEEIKKHLFFKDVSFDDVYHRTTILPDHRKCDRHEQFRSGVHEGTADVDTGAYAVERGGSAGVCGVLLGECPG